SPFPGMDPFVEACGLWGDFHSRLIGAIRNTLLDSLPSGYVARSGLRHYVVQSMPSSNRPHKSPGAETEPVLLRAFIEEEYEEQFIDIFELEPERRLVTSIEVLSPSNKKRRSPGWKKYLRKRQALLLGKANLVELDLL